MHPHLPNQTVLLPAQVDPGAHHSGYRKFRQGPPQLSKSEVPFACRLSPVDCRPSPGSRPCRPVFPWPANKANRISSHRIAVVLCCLVPLLLLHPSSPVSPLTAREPAPSAGQGTRLYNTSSKYIQAHRQRRHQAQQGKGHQSSTGKPAVNSRRRPVRRLPRSPRTTSLSPRSHLFTHLSRQPGCERPRATAPARQAKPSTQQQQPKGRAKSFQRSIF